MLDWKNAKCYVPWKKTEFGENQQGHPTSLEQLFNKKIYLNEGSKRIFFLKLRGTGEQKAILGNMAHKKSKLDFGKRLFKGNKGTDEPHHEKTCLQGYQPGMTRTECSATEMSQRFEILDIESIDIILSRQMHRLICIFVVRIWHKQDFS